MDSQLNIGLALGSGSSRGWSHIGIISALADLGVEANVICGTSIGALVGASYISNKLNKLEEWIRSLTKLDIVRFLEINTSLTGFIDKERLHSFLIDNVADENATIENYTKRYAAVTTDLETGREIWLTKGSLTDAVWASISIPGLFPAIKNDNRWLVDGGLVNPVPVSTCRALGADIVIAVNLNGDIVGKHFQKTKEAEEKVMDVRGKVNSFVREYTRSLFSKNSDDEQTPSLFDAIAGSLNITQDRITRSRMAGDPPDILLSPKLSHIGLLEFHRGEEAISEGKNCVQRMKSEIEYLLKQA